MVEYLRGWLLVFALSCLWPAVPAGAVAEDFEKPADSLVQSSWPADGPGAAVIVTEQGAIVYGTARGLADIDTSRPITLDTVFRLGSITKQFTAALILRLADKGLLSLDDPLSKFVPDFPEPGAHATVRQLLNHTSGIRSYTSLPAELFGGDATRSYTTAEIIDLVREEPADFEPGTDHLYNNSGYVLLAAVIENVTGLPWHQALAEEITGPLGLTTIRHELEEGDEAARARPYSAGPDGVRPARPIHMSLPSAAGALVGSVRDMARWAHALHHGQVLSPASYAQMIAPTQLPDGRTVPYGFGLRLENVHGFDTIGHGGGIDGGLTDSLYLPERDLFVAVFVNSDSPRTQPGLATRRLAALAAGNPYPAFQQASVDPAVLVPLFGVYSGPGEDGEWRFYDRGAGQLVIRGRDEPERPVFPAGKDRFFFGPNSLDWFEALREPSGAIRLAMHPGGADEAVVYTRTGPIPPDPVVPRRVLERYVGRYQLTGTIATIGLTPDNRLTVELTGQPPGTLRTIGPNAFAGDAVGVRISFEGDGPHATLLRSRIGSLVNEGPRLLDTD